MHVTVLTLFPEYFTSVWQTSMIKRAQERHLIACSTLNIRDFAQGAHQVTDDRPFGGGPGMVLMVEPIDLALQSLGAAENKKRKIVLTSAKGVPYTQQKAREYARLDELVIICGHYEGVDERVAEHLVDEEVCIGEYVLTGGEPAAAVVVDSVARLLPGVLGNELSNQDESHDEPGKMGYPQFTQPRNYKGWEVPEVLLSGDHQKIAQWREERRNRAKPR